MNIIFKNIIGEGPLGKVNFDRKQGTVSTPSFPLYSFICPLSGAKWHFPGGQKATLKGYRKILLAPVCSAEPARVGKAAVWEKPPEDFLERARAPGCPGRLSGAHSHCLSRLPNLRRQSLEPGKWPKGRAARVSTCLAALRGGRGGLGAAGWWPGGEARPTWA